jgi:hypothetical protein
MQALDLQALGRIKGVEKEFKNDTTNVSLRETYRKNCMRSLAQCNPRKQREQNLRGCMPFRACDKALPKRRACPRE